MESDDELRIESSNTKDEYASPQKPQKQLIEAPPPYLTEFDV